MKIGFGIYLCWISVQDIREKAVSLWKLLLGALGILLWYFCVERGLPAIQDLLPGIFCLLIAGISKEQIGLADGVVLLLTGMCCGWRVCSYLTCGALLSASLWGIGILCLRRGQQRIRVAWLPFLTANYFIWEVFHWMKG